MVVECAYTGREAPRLEPVVGTDPAEQRTTGRLEHAQHVLVQADVGLIAGQCYAAVGAGVVLKRLEGPVIRRVVADDELEIGELLRQDRFDATSDYVATVSHGEPDGKRRRILPHRRNLAGNGAAPAGGRRRR